MDLESLTALKVAMDGTLVIPKFAFDKQIHNVISSVDPNYPCIRVFSGEAWNYNQILLCERYPNYYELSRARERINHHASDACLGLDKVLPLTEKQMKYANITSHCLLASYGGGQEFSLWSPENYSDNRFLEEFAPYQTFKHEDFAAGFAIRIVMA